MKIDDRENRPHLKPTDRFEMSEDYWGGDHDEDWKFGLPGRSIFFHKSPKGKLTLDDILTKFAMPFIAFAIQTGNAVETSLGVFTYASIRKPSKATHFELHIQFKNPFRDTDEELRWAYFKKQERERQEKGEVA